MKNIIIVGPDHQNTLGVIRAIGKEGYQVDLVIYSDIEHKCKCRASRFVNGKYINCAENEQTIIDSILQLAGNSNTVPVIPTSDFAAMCIDKNYHVLCKKCVLPSIKEKEGLIFKYMDKFSQSKLAKEYGVEMAKTIKIELPFEREIPEIGYPCVLKPVVSASGLKSDIMFAHNQWEFFSALKKYNSNGYHEVLIQQFIKKDYEVCIFGCITKNSKEVYCGALKKLRYSPIGDGASLSFAQFIKIDKRLESFANLLKNLGYNGLFDIEVFVVGNRLYLNEINFRNSGNAWAVVNRGINVPVIWIKDCLGEHINSETGHFIDDESFFMNETADLRNVIKRNISPFQWMRDVSKTKSFNKFWSKDIKGSLVWYRR